MILSNLWLLSGPVSSVLSSYETDAIQRTTTAVTMFNAGFKENVMPSSAEVIHLCPHPFSSLFILVHPCSSLFIFVHPCSSSCLLKQATVNHRIHPTETVEDVLEHDRSRLCSVKMIFDPRPGRWLMTVEWRSRKARTASIRLRSLPMPTTSWPSKSLQMPPSRCRPPLENVQWQKIRCFQKATLLLAPS